MATARHSWQNGRLARDESTQCKICGIYMRRGFDGCSRYFAASTSAGFLVQQFPNRPPCKPRTDVPTN